jgi:hypothetical protein
MIVKAVEIRDKATFVPAMAIKMVPATEGQRYLLRRAGYDLHGPPSIMLVRMVDCRAEYDPYSWPDLRTMRHAHLWIAAHFDEMSDSGDVVDVEFILSETKEPKRSEQFEASL